MAMRRATSFQTLVDTCDVISFHCPKTPETEGMLSEATLPAGDHPGLFVVNCARGGIADEAALLAGLADGRLRGVALDSVTTEPSVPPALLEALASGKAENLLITPHAAFYSDEAFQEMRGLAAREIGRILRGEPAQYQVN
jgi:D-3-phosphoglycerate dehydrogenase